MKRLVPLLLAGLLSAQTELPVRVITAGQGWLQGTRQLTRGDRLSAVTSLTGKEPSDLVLDCGPAGWLSYSCARYPCSIPVCSTKVDSATVRRVDPDAPKGSPGPSVREM